MTFGDINQSIWSWGGELLNGLHNFSEKQASKHSSLSSLLRVGAPSEIYGILCRWWALARHFLKDKTQSQGSGTEPSILSLRPLRVLVVAVMKRGREPDFNIPDDVDL